MIERRRRLIIVVVIAVSLLGGAFYESFQNRGVVQPATTPVISPAGDITTSPASQELGKLAVKGRAPRTGYTRAQFGDGWNQAGMCNVRNFILKRDMSDVKVVSDTNCDVVSGTLDDPYTGKKIAFMRGPTTSDDVQIDHVVALSDAWQKGAQQLSAETRRALANDPLNLLAVDGPTNQKKGDGDAATWLPPNKDYRCRYVARQIAVKVKYVLWVTQAEHDAMQKVLDTCPGQVLPLVL